MEDSTVQSDVVNEFLMTLTEVKDFLSNNEGRKPQRTQIFQAIHRKIAERLSIIHQRQLNV